MTRTSACASCGSLLMRLISAAPRGVAANSRSSTTSAGRCSMIACSAWIGSVSANVETLSVDLHALAQRGHEVLSSDHQYGRGHPVESSMSTKHDADVIVAGAGPAGATAALRLARAGVRVLVVERFRAAATETVRRRHQHARALALSVAAERARRAFRSLPVSSLYLEGPSGGVFRMQIRRARGDADPPDRVRCTARVARGRGRRARPGARRRSRRRSRTPTASRCAPATDASCARRWSSRPTASTA